MDEYLVELLDCDDLTTEETVEVLDAGEFDRAQQRAEAIKGGVVVAATNDDGEVLLVENDWLDGYGFPGGGVEPGEDWEQAAVREAKEETGIDVEIDRPWRIVRGVLAYREERLVGHSVFYRASTVGDTTVAAKPGTAEEVIEAVGWFDEVPERAVRPDLIQVGLEDN